VLVLYLTIFRGFATMAVQDEPFSKEVPP